MQDTKLFGNLFLSVGAMKAGTTWLYAVLSRHPELHFSPEKEIHYFHHKYVDSRMLDDEARLRHARDKYIFRFDPNTSNIDRVRLNLRWASAYLSRPVDDFWYRNLFQTMRGAKYACDFSNLNALLPEEAWPQIEGQCDKLRVLYTMRDPVKRLWSHTKFHLQVSNQLDNLEKWGPEQFENFVRKPFIWDNAEYGRCLRRLSNGLNGDNWMPVFYEDIHSDQLGTLRKIEEFLGIRPFDYPKGVMQKRFTESVKHPMPDFFPKLFDQDVKRIKNEVTELGYQIPESW